MRMPGSVRCEGTAEGGRSGGNSGLILTAERSGWLIENGTADPFSAEMRNGI